MSDGTVVMSDRLFARLLPGNRDSAAALPIEAIVIKVTPGEDGVRGAGGVARRASAIRCR